MKWIDRQFKKLVARKQKELLDDSKVKVQNWPEILSKLDNVPLVDAKDEGIWWVQDGYLYGTGRYIPIIEQLIKENNNG